jgi:hypothetical protein
MFLYIPIHECTVERPSETSIVEDSDADVERMLARGRAIRCLFVYAPKSGSCSAMEGILWELQRKLRVFHQSAETFWLHNGTVVDRKLIPMQSWAPPLLVPWQWITRMDSTCILFFIFEVSGCFYSVLTISFLFSKVYVFIRYVEKQI